jgi:hypothetical protein
VNPLYLLTSCNGAGKTTAAYALRPVLPKFYNVILQGISLGYGGLLCFRQTLRFRYIRAFHRRKCLDVFIFKDFRDGRGRMYLFLSTSGR